MATYAVQTVGERAIDLAAELSLASGSVYTVENTGQRPARLFEGGAAAPSGDARTFAPGCLPGPANARSVTVASGQPIWCWAEIGETRISVSDG